MLEHRAYSDVSFAAADSFWNVHAFDEVDSTNTRIKEAIAQGEPEGTCFVARRQSAAYGRQGRTWSSPEGGLYFSFILDPLGAHELAEKTLAHLPALSLLLSLAVQSALERFTQSEAIKIKWPNDILVVEEGQAAKLCGISLEVVGGKLCCGIGINVARPETASVGEPEAGNVPAYLSDLLPASSTLKRYEETLQTLLPEVLNMIVALYRIWLRTGISFFIPKYDAHLYNIGQHVTLDSLTGKELYTGTVRGVSPSGELILQASDGTQITANSGEVHTRH